MTEEKIGFRKPNFEAMRAALKGEGGCGGRCQAKIKRGNPARGAIGGWWLEQCSGICARPECHDDNHLCKHHYGQTPKQTDGHDPCYDGIRYTEEEE